MIVIEALLLGIHLLEMGSAESSFCIPKQVQLVQMVRVQAVGFNARDGIIAIGSLRSWYFQSLRLFIQRMADKKRVWCVRLRIVRRTLGIVTQVTRT